MPSLRSNYAVDRSALCLRCVAIMRSIRLHRAVVVRQLCGLCGNDTVSELINGCIDKVKEGLHDLEHSGCALQPVGSREKVLRDRVTAGVILAADVFRVGEVLRKSLGDGFHPCFSQYGKQAVERIAAHDAVESFRLFADALAYGTQDVRRQAVGSSGYQTAFRFQVHVVSAMVGLLAPGIDVGSEMAFVGRLVGRKAGVAVEPVGAVGHRQILHGRVECGNAHDQVVYHAFESSPCLVVEVAVLVKPFAVVVDGDLSQILQADFCPFIGRDMLAHKNHQFTIWFGLQK